MGPRPDGRGRQCRQSQSRGPRTVNGAAAGWPRKAAASTMSEIKSRLPSMGPRPDGRGRPRGSAATPATRPPSMGPRPDGRGRRLVFCPMSLRPAPVNGAAAGWPRKVRRRWRRGPMPAPSMGPRPDGRGRGSRRRRSFRLRRPSMGPRPDGRGRAHNGAARILGYLPSMGPRPDGRGRHSPQAPAAPPASVNGAAAGWPRKAAQHNPAYTAGKFRQWGRGRMAAEGRTMRYARDRTCPAVNGAAAGWPRKARSPEGWQGCAGAVNGAAAGWPRKERLHRLAGVLGSFPSMGPRPDGRGRAARKTLESGQDVTVNGAAAGWPRKAFRTGGTTCSRSPSMGPRPDGRGRCGRGACSPGGRCSVNGAAAGWPRKVAAGAGRVRGILPSMGPRPDGRGRRRPRPAGRGGGRSPVNGAAAGWPRKAATARSTTSSTPAVNGAAAGWPRKECWRIAPVWPAPTVNGAAAGWPRKDIGWLERERSNCPPSMGPRPDGRGRQFPAMCTAMSAYTVNGAAAGWPRKVSCSAQKGLIRFSRQWGRGRMAAEGVAVHPAARADAYPSMGPRPDGRGRLGARSVSALASKPSMGPRPDGRGRDRTGCGRAPGGGSVNGAAAGWPRKAC